MYGKEKLKFVAFYGRFASAWEWFRDCFHVICSENNAHNGSRCNAEKYGKTIFNQFSRRFKDGYSCDSDVETPTMDRAERKTLSTFR